MPGSPRLALIAAILVIGLAPFAAAQIQGHGIGCSFCGHPTHAPWHYSTCRMYSSGGNSSSSSSGGSNLSYEQRIENLKNSPYIYRALIATPVSMLGMMFLMPIGVLTGNFEFTSFLLEHTYYATEPFWIGPFLLLKGGFNYFAMNLFEVDEEAYKNDVKAVRTEASKRQSEAQRVFANAMPRSGKTGRQLLAERLAAAKQQAEERERQNHLRRVARGIREQMNRMDAPQTRVRMLETRVDSVSTEALCTIESGDLRTANYDELLFSGLGIATAAYGTPGEVFKHGVKAAAAAVDTQRELAVLEMSRLENRALKLKALQKMLADTAKLPPEERKRAIQETLSLAAPLLTRARADAGLTPWRFLENARSRSENWKHLRPVLAKRVATYGLGMAAGEVIKRGVKKLPSVNDLPDLQDTIKGTAWGQFFRGLGKESLKEGVGAAAGKINAASVDFVDRLVRRAAGGVERLMEKRGEDK